MKLHDRIFSLHRIMGILCGLLLVVMALTGSAIMFYQYSDRAPNPQLVQVPPQGERISIDTMRKSAQAYYS